MIERRYKVLWFECPYCREKFEKYKNLKIHHSMKHSKLKD